MDGNMDVDRTSMVLPTLNKSNYQRWKFDVKLVLESLELLDIVLSIEKKPAGAEDIKKWRKLDAKARRVLSSGFDDELHATIRSCSTAYEMWKMVTELHEAKSESNKYLVNQVLCALKFTEEKSVAGYCAEMSTIRSLRSWDRRWKSLKRLRSCSRTYHHQGLICFVTRTGYKPLLARRSPSRICRRNCKSLRATCREPLRRTSM